MSGAGAGRVRGTDAAPVRGTDAAPVRGTDEAATRGTDEAPVRGTDEAATVRNRIEVMHGVNLDQLGRRDRAHYGDLTLAELERQVSQAAAQLGLVTRFFQTNHEGEFVEHLHRLQGLSDGIIINPGAWTHYSYAIHDALELTGLPAVEVHLSDIDNREQWRRQSVISELCIDRWVGLGADGYTQALVRLRQELT